MKKDWKNSVAVRGYLFSVKNLNKRVAKDGSNYISGVVNVAADENAMNVVSVFFYAPERFKSGNSNDTYLLLNDILLGNYRTYEQVGKDAPRLRIDASISPNDFVGRDGNVVTSKQIRGSFAHLDDRAPSFHAQFDADCVINVINEREFEGEESSVTVKGFTCGFRGDMIPVEFSVRDPQLKEYFLSQEVSSANPMIANMRGEIVNNTVTRETVEDNAMSFGKPRVKTTSRSFQSWDITGGTRLGEFEDGNIITRDDIKRMKADRDVVVARVKERAANRQSSRNSGGNGFSGSNYGYGRPNATYAASAHTSYPSEGFVANANPANTYAANDNTDDFDF